jgi:tetratricopeptide (TPR) repeat protein
MPARDELPNYYDILGIPEYASALKIKEAYVALDQKCRYEWDADDPTDNCREEMGAIEEAYLVLSDAAKRRQYDELRLTDQATIHALKAKAAFQMPTDFRAREAIYRQGLEHLRNGRNADAAVCLRKVMQHEKNNPFLLKLTAKAYLAAGQSRLATQVIEKVIELEPDDWDGYLMLGKLREQQKKLLAARRCFRLAYRLNSRNPLVVAEFERGSLVLEKIVIGLRSALRHLAPDPNARSLRLSDGLIRGEMLATLKANRKVRCFFAGFLPDQHARSFRLEDGLITRRMVARAAAVAREKLTPRPSRYTFRYTGVA